MATVKWSALTSRGTVLDNTAGQLNALANNGFSSLSSAHDNSSNLDRWGFLELKLGSFTATAGASVSVYLVPSVDGGSDYNDTPSSTNPGGHMLVATLSITSGASAKIAVTSVPFALPPGHFKFCVRNQTGAAFANSATNALVFYTSNESVA